MESMDGTTGTQRDVAERFAEQWWEAAAETDSAYPPMPAERATALVIRAERV